MNVSEHLVNYSLGAVFYYSAKSYRQTNFAIYFLFQAFSIMLFDFYDNANLDEREIGVGKNDSLSKLFYSAVQRN